MTILLIILVIVAVLFVGLLHLGFRAPRIRETKTPDDFGIPFYEVSIPTVTGKQLYGWLLPVSGSSETLVILHGWGSNAELMLPIAIPFYRVGMNILLVDARNHGNSDSDSFSSLPRFAEDLGKAIDWLKQNHTARTKKIALLGHSVGAGAVLFEASKRDDIDAVISVSAFAHPEWMMQRFLKSVHLRGVHLPGFVLNLIMRYVQWIIGHSFSAIAPLHTVCKIVAPILVVHGKDDSIVPVEDARAILANCPEPHITLLEIDDAGHDSVDKIELHGEKLISFLQNAGFCKFSSKEISATNELPSINS